MVDLPHHLQLDTPESDRREVLATTIIDARPRAIVNLPHDSLMPLLTALAIAISLVGVLAEAYWLSLLGVVATVGSIGIWLWPGGSDWGPDHPGHHELPPTRPVDPEEPTPGRGTTWYGTVIGVLTIVTGFVALLFTYFYLRLDEAVWPPAGLPIPDPLLPAVAAILLLASGGVLWWAMRRAHRLETGIARLGILVASGLGAVAAVCQGASMVLIDLAPGDHAYASIALVLGWTIVLLLTVGVALLLAVAIRSLREPLHTGSTAGAEDAVTFWAGMVGISLAGILVLTTAPYVI